MIKDFCEGCGVLLSPYSDICENCGFDNKDEFSDVVLDLDQGEEMDHIQATDMIGDVREGVLW